MVRGVTLTVAVALAWLVVATASVLVPTYVLPPDSFTREQRSLDSNPDSNTADSQRTIRRLIGGHIKIKPEKDYGNPSKNSFAYSEKKGTEKFAGVVVTDQSGGSVGWNQGIWDDGMLMSSAGEGKETKGAKKENDEDAKTLSDQVAEGKYGLIQNELFAKPPKRPGIVSYMPNSETSDTDNLQSLGGLKKEEIWLAEDHLLVLKGGSFPERTKDTEKNPWPPIDDYEAPKRQVKLPQKPKVPPPFPVQLSDDGPLVFLTPNGSFPAALFPALSQGESESSLPPPPFPFPPGASHAPGEYPRNTTSGGAPYPAPPFPFFPGNASEGAFFPFPPSINASFPEGFPPGVAFLPPPSNQNDLYDEDDPSIYYPPPYNFSYHAENKSRVPAGPLVPGIVLPPPPDFFAPLEEKFTTEHTKLPNEPETTTNIRYKPTTTKRPTTQTFRKPYKRPTTTESSQNKYEPTTLTTPPTVEIVTIAKPRPTPQRVVQIPYRAPIRVQNQPEDKVRPKTERPVYKNRSKPTSKPLSVSVIYEEPQYTYVNKPAVKDKPYVVYSIPEKAQTVDITDNFVTSTPVPLRAYFSRTQNEEVPTTKLQPVYNRKPTENAVASFYFFDEQPKSKPNPGNYFDSHNYYKTINLPVNQQPQNKPVFNPSVDVSYGSFDQSDAFYLWPQKQGPRTLTQEYFSIQKPAGQGFVPQAPRPDFYRQIAEIQQTIDLFTTSKPKVNPHRGQSIGMHKPKAITSRPVYQFSYQTKSRPEQLFRAPKLDPEPFRPMVSYSKPLNLEDDFNAITPSNSPDYRQYLIEKVQVSTETPTSSRYYPKTKLREDEYDDIQVKEIRNSQNKNRNHITTNEKPATYNIIRSQDFPSTTQNPISHGYYTKQDERYFDDITKNSFDIFGKKIEDNAHDINGLAVTPPLGTVKTPVNNNINLQYAHEVVETQTKPPKLDSDALVNYRFPRPPVNLDSESIYPEISHLAIQQQKPPSLASDTLVNERLPRPTINPDSEFIPIANPGYGSAQQYNLPLKSKSHYTGEQYDLNQPSLAGDIAVNYRRPLPPHNPDAEWIQPVNTAGEGRPGSFVSYRLPGDGAHVYFLTPQAAQAAKERYRTTNHGR